MSSRKSGQPFSTRFIAGITLVLVGFLWSCVTLSGYPGVNLNPFKDSTMAAGPYSHLASHCAHISGISKSEYHIRQIELAKKLHALNASAYIAEPGANTQFYGNFSQLNWRLSERPLLLIISPLVVSSGSESRLEIQPQVTILTPKFEATRAKLLPVPSANDAVRYVEWPEEGDPYAAALSALELQSVLATSSTKLRATKPVIFVDNSIRKFIVDGLNEASQSLISSISSRTLSNVYDSTVGINILSAPLDITQMRERKSESELGILKCVNEATLLAIREIHQKLYPGILETQARTMMATALGAAGLKDGGCLTLFGENAALPHGSGTNRRLGKSDFALFDCTASLHGYYSDVTRTVALSSQGLSKEKLRIWRLVRSGQRAALAAARNGTVAQDVDKAVRTLFEQAGNRDEKYFTHRLGHGIGLEVHESPYLRGGSKAILRPGHTFSDEPGIYIEGKVGVRLEDCFYINEDGIGVFLTEGIGGQSSEPWLP